MILTFTDMKDVELSLIFVYVYVIVCVPSYDAFDGSSTIWIVVVASALVTYLWTV